MLGFMESFNTSIRVTKGQALQQTTSRSSIHNIDIQFDPLYTEYTYSPLSIVQALSQIGGFISALKIAGVILTIYHFYGFRRDLTKQHADTMKETAEPLPEDRSVSGIIQTQYSDNDRSLLV